MGFKLLNRYYDLLFPANLTVVDKLSELFKEGSALLDAGCGTGSYALLLAQKGFKVTGIDINPDFINIAKEKAKDKSEVDFFLIRPIFFRHLQYRQYPAPFRQERYPKSPCKFLSSPDSRRFISRTDC